jgi:RHS repeat-associated protein
MTQEKGSRVVRNKGKQVGSTGMNGRRWPGWGSSGLAMIVAILCSLQLNSAHAMPPGWTKGCLKPVYGSGEAACATGLDTPGATFVFDPIGGSCNYFGPFGAPFAQQSLCEDCPSGYFLDEQRSCSPLAEFNGPDPYADVGSQGRPDEPAVDPINGDDSCPDADPAMVGNPINARTGNKYQREVDYVGAGTFPLTFVRHYNSQFTFQSQLGLGWRDNYDRQILPQSGTRVTVVRPNGQAFEFKLAANAWSSTTDIVDKLKSFPGGGWQLATQSDEVETYDANGRLMSISNRAGLTQRLIYSTTGTPPNVAPRAGLLITVSDPAGRQLNFTYDPQLRIKTLTDPGGNVFRYSYNNHFGLLTSVSYPGASNPVRTYLYQFAGANPLLGNALTGIIDENGQTFAAYTYDPTTGRAIGSSHGGTLAANPYTLTYNRDGTTAVADAHVSRTYNFQTVMGVPRVTGINQSCSACGSSSLSARSYDANGFVSSANDFNGNVTSYQHNDPYGRVDLETSQTEAVGKPESRTTTKEWDPGFRLVHRIAEALRITTMTYDSHGNILNKTIQATTDPSGALGLSAPLTGVARSWVYTYTYSDTMPGQVTHLVVDGPRTDVADITISDWDASGNLSSVVNALGHVTAFADYDANGRPRRITDPNGLVTTLSYEPRGRLAARDVGGELTAYDYDAVGQLKTQTSPDGSFVSFTYDAAHRLIGIQDNLGNSIGYTLDAMGNRVAEQVFDPNQVLTRRRAREFNALNRLVKDVGGTDPSAQIRQYGYDSQGNLTSLGDPLGHITTNVYDALNRLARTIDPSATGTGAGNATQYTHDGADQLTAVTDPRNLITSYTIDGLGNLIALNSPDTAQTTSTFDEAGNLAQRTDARGVIASFTYDALNRVTQATYSPPAASNIAPVSIVYRYDQGPSALGRLSEIIDPNGSITYAYDAHGRLIRDVRAIAGTNYTTAYRYDAAGRLASVTYPSGRTVDYRLDAAARIMQIDTTYRSVTQSVVSNVAYQPFGSVKSFTYGNAQASNRQFDLDGRITNYVLGSLSRAVSYDADSRIIAFKHDNPILDQRFSYDNLDRLTGWSSTATSQSFLYDAVGNRTNQTVNARAYASSYSGTSNRLVRSEFPVAFNYQYDAVGNTTQDALRTYSYDARSRLTQVAIGGVTIRFVVNGLGQRVWKSPSNGLPRVFHYDLVGRLIAESTTTGEVLREYVYLGDVPVALISSDHDDDGVPDSRDNCILDANPDQRDTSGSGFGNVCNGDANGDGLLNQADRNLVITMIRRPGVSNPTAMKRADLNGDGVLDYQDDMLLAQRISQRGTIGPSGLQGQSPGPEVFYIYSDQIGAPRVLVDASNKVRWQWDPADPFGVEPADDSPQSDFVALPFNLRFPGQYYDRETGLHYNYFRDYDPATGRYIQSDPVGLQGGINTYNYAGQNPLSYADPTGQWVWMVIPGLCAAGGCELLFGGTALWCMLNQTHNLQSSSSGGDNAAEGSSGDTKQPVVEKDKKRFFDKGQKDRARDRSRDAEGDPRCEYCGVKTTNEPGKPNSSQGDHIESWVRGGRTTDENAANSCARCNSSKGSKELGTEWIPPRNR